MPISAKGTTQDNIKKSFVESPSRPYPDTAQEVYVGNTASNPIPVDVIDPSATGTTLNNYSESLSVAGLATTTIISYTVPVGKYFAITRVDYSGSKTGVFTIEINSSVEAKKRLYCTDYNGEFIMGGLRLAAGDIIELIVENKTNTAGDFNGNLIGNLDNA